MVHIPFHSQRKKHTILYIAYACVPFKVITCTRVCIEFVRACIAQYIRTKTVRACVRINSYISNSAFEQQLTVINNYNVYYSEQ